MKKFFYGVVAASFIAVGLSVSKYGNQVDFIGQVHAAASVSVSVDDVVKGYSEQVFVSYNDAAQKARELQTAIDAFLVNPSPSTLKNAKQVWLEGREVYGQTEVYRFYGGPIDDENGIEGQINAWPMDESYVDYVKGALNAGLIQRGDFEISAASLISVNERGGEENVATGWHAIEFLLWGQDLNVNGPGNRPFTDYVVGDENKEAVQRRRDYLTAVTELLVNDLESLVASWVPDSSVNYRARFEEGGIDSLRKIFIGMGSLSRGELAGERMEVALFSQDQEDEHSCFSDNTHRDVVANAQGILNIWQGRYVRANGEVVKVPAVEDLVAAHDLTTAQETSQQITKSVQLANRINAPFDNEIMGGSDDKGRLRIQSTVNSLIKQSGLIVAAANAVGVQKLTLAQP